MVVSSYPVMDLAVLAVLLRLLMTPGRRPTALLLVLVSFAVLLVGDAVYAVLQQTDSYAPGWLDATWLFAYLGLGVAALHPSMRELSTRDPRSTPTPLGWIRIWLLGSALLVGPILMVYAPDDRTIPVAGLTALISVLVLWRFVRTTRQRQRAEDSLTHSALHDPVTGLPNRRLLVDRLRQAIARNRRGGEGLAVLFLDLDRFKQVNDGLGHAAGDLLLGAIGQRLIGAVRPADTVARMGGDEFVIVCEGVRTPADAGRAADRIMDVLSRPFELPEGETFVTASVGISMASRAGMSAEEMLHEADVAMYRAKLSGRDRRAFFDESMRVEAESRLQRANELHHALQRDEFALLYQPLVALQGEAVVGVEALVRWHHPTEGLVAPDRFIPLAESTGLIVPLGRWIADAALAQAARWQATGGALARLSMAINVSAIQLREPGFADELIGLVGDRRVEPGRIYIELTESALIDDDLRAEEVLKKLRAAGLHLAIDDFGTGYSSLSYLQRYPVDRLKIDRSFVAGLDVVEGATAIVETILAMAATLGLDVIAEGVETPQQRDRLRGLGCAFGQGFLFGRPMPSEDLAALVGGWTSADASVLERMLMGGASPEPGP
jgi:diguanylate cyclase (GGDEF)-like protein